MADDDLLKELLTSPLEEPPRRRRRTGRDEGSEPITPDGTGAAGSRGDIPRVPLLWGLGAAVVGAVIVIAGYSVASEDPIATTTTSTTTTTVALDTAAPAGLPAGYVAVGDRLGMRVERILARADGVFVTVTTVVENSLDPSATTGFQGGLWTLVLEDGRRITSTVESFDALARGTVSVQFPADGYAAEDVVSIELNGTATRTTNSLQFAFEQPVTLGEDGAESVPIDPERFALDAGVTLQLDPMELTPTAGTMPWRLTGDATANAIVSPLLTVLDPSGDETVVPPNQQSSVFDALHPSIPGPVLEPSGVAAVSMPTGSSLPTEVPLEGVLTLEVTWAVYDPIVVSLPIAAADVTTVAP